MNVVIHDRRPEPEYLVQYEHLTNRAARRRARKVLRCSVPIPGWNVPYKRPFWQKPGKSLAALADRADQGLI